MASSAGTVDVSATGVYTIGVAAPGNGLTSVMTKSLYVINASDTNLIETMSLAAVLYVVNVLIVISPVNVYDFVSEVPSANVSVMASSTVPASDIYLKSPTSNE